MNYDELKAIEASWNTPVDDFASAKGLSGGWGEPIILPPTFSDSRAETPVGGNPPYNNDLKQDERLSNTNIQLKEQPRENFQSSRMTPSFNDNFNVTPREADECSGGDRQNFNSLGYGEGSRRQAASPSVQRPGSISSQISNQSGANKDTCTLEWLGIPEEIDISNVLKIFDEAKGASGIRMKAVRNAARLTFENSHLARLAIQIFRETHQRGSMVPVFEPDSAQQEHHRSSIHDNKHATSRSPSVSRWAAGAESYRRPSSTSQWSNPGPRIEEAPQSRSTENSGWDGPITSSNKKIVGGWDSTLDSTGNVQEPQTRWDPSHDRASSSSRFAPTVEQKTFNKLSNESWDAPIVSTNSSSDWQAANHQIHSKSPIDTLISNNNQQESQNRASSSGYNGKQSFGSRDAPVVDSKTSWDAPIAATNSNNCWQESHVKSSNLDIEPSTSNWDAPIVGSKTTSWDAPRIDPTPNSNSHGFLQSKQNKGGWDAPIIESTPDNSQQDSHIRKSSPNRITYKDSEPKPFASNWDAPIVGSKASSWDAPIIDSTSDSNLQGFSQLKQNGGGWNAPVIDTTLDSSRQGSHGKPLNQCVEPPGGNGDAPIAGFKSTSWDAPIVDPKPKFNSQEAYQSKQSSGGWDAPINDTARDNSWHSAQVAPIIDHKPIISKTYSGNRDSSILGSRSQSNQQEPPHYKPSQVNAVQQESSYDKVSQSSWDTPITETSPVNWQKHHSDKSSGGNWDLVSDLKSSPAQQEFRFNKPSGGNWDEPLIGTDPGRSFQSSNSNYGSSSDYKSHHDNSSPRVNSDSPKSIWDVPVVGTKPNNSREPQRSNSRNSTFNSLTRESDPNVACHDFHRAHSDAKKAIPPLSSSGIHDSSCLKIINYPTQGSPADLLKKICGRPSDISGLAFFTPTVLYVKFGSHALAETASQKYQANVAQGFSLIAEPPRDVHFLANSNLKDLLHIETSLKSLNLSHASETISKASPSSSPEPQTRAHSRIKPQTDNGPAQRMIAHALGRRIPRT